MINADYFSDYLLKLAKDLKLRLNCELLASGPSLPVDYNSDSRYALGGRHSYVPDLGKTMWNSSSAAEDKNSITAKIFELDDSVPIGYIRVPHYIFDDEEIEVYSRIISKFNRETAVLIFDQINNPGGKLFHAYSILSHLTDSILKVPMHRMNIDDVLIDESKDILWSANFKESNNNEEWPTPELIRYSNFVLSEVKEGRAGLTNPGFAYGLEEIKPSSDPYTKPIIVLISALTFSAPEYLVSIIQDCQRGILFGENTAGAGGLMKIVSGNKELGIENFTYTWAYAIRVNGEIIESNGIHPDIPYSITADDLQNDYSGYKNELIKTIRMIL